MNFKLLHLCDSLFPIGGFGFSDGLEAAAAVRLKPDTPYDPAVLEAAAMVRLKPDTTNDRDGRGDRGSRTADHPGHERGSFTSAGDVPTRDEAVSMLRDWLDVCLTEALGRAEGPAVWRGWRAFLDNDVAALTAIDEEVIAIRPAGATRRATRAMGLRLVTTWQALYPDPRIERLLGVARRQPTTGRSNLAPSLAAACASSGVAGRGELSVRGERQRDVGHGLLVPSLPVAFAVACASSGVGRRESVEAFVYTRLASTISAAMRLMPIGQTDAHAVLARTLDDARAVVDGIEAGRDSIECFTPAMDIAMMSQQYLHSRLFRS
jgi:urease accessory protein UreF